MGVSRDRGQTDPRPKIGANLDSQAVLWISSPHMTSLTDRVEQRIQKSHRLRRAFGALTVFAIIFSAGAYWRLPLATKVLRAGLDNAGFHHVSFKVTGLSISRLQLTHVQMKPEVRVKTAEVEFDLSRLPEMPLTRITLNGVRGELTTKNKKAATSSASLDPETIRSLLNQAAQFPAVTIKDLSLKLAPTGDIVTLTGSTEAKPQNGGTRTVQYKLKITGNFAGKTHTVLLNGTSGIQTSAATANTHAKITYESNGKKLSRPANVASHLSLIRNSLTLDNKITLPDMSIVSTKGKHDLVTGNGNISLTLPARQITTIEKELRTLAPSVSEIPDFRIQSGTMQATAALVWDKQGFNGTAAIGIKNMDLVDSASDSAIRGLSADIQLDQLFPPRTPPGQTVRIKQISAGVLLNDLSMQFALIKGATADIPALQIDAFQLLIAGGRLNIAPTTVDSAADSNQATIMVKNINLATVLSAAGIDGVSGSGRLSGRIPIGMTGKAVHIDGGRLATDKPGVLQIRSETVNNALSQGGPEVALMLSALENFQYKKLSLTIEKEIAGQGRVVLHTRGHNPAVRSGQPFIINLNLTGHVDRLAAVAAQAFQLPGTLVRAMLPKQP